MRWAPVVTGVVLAVMTGCAEPPVKAPVVESKLAKTISLKHLPYRVDSNSLDSSIQGREGDIPITNQAMALFDLNSVVAFARLDSNSKTDGTTSSAGMASTELFDGTVATELAKAENATTTLAEETSSTRLSEDSTSTESTESRTKQETSEQVEGVSTSEKTIRTEGSLEGDRTLLEQKGFSSESDRRFASRANSIEFMTQHIEALKQRSSALGTLITQDQILRRFFELSAEELRQEIESSTNLAGSVLSLEKTISVDEIIPGETFTYELLLKNASTSPVRSVVLYDEFPRGLQFESLSETIEVKSQDGAVRVLTHGDESLVGFLTPNEWEEGKIAWYVPGHFYPSESIKLTFEATWYLERGVCSSNQTQVYCAPDRASELAGSAHTSDLLFVISRPEEGDFLPVSIRRSGSGERVEGFIESTFFIPFSELDATDIERRLSETVYFNQEGPS